MKYLPKDLEAKRDGLAVSYDDTSYGDHSRGFDAGAQAVLEHEQIKKLEEALEHHHKLWTEYHADDYCLSECSLLCKALADFRAWRDGK